jgi:hypothetical protein
MRLNMTFSLVGANFTSTCGTLLERMINTVPKAVTLKDPLQVAELKLASLEFSPTANGDLATNIQLRVHPFPTVLL